ncbi:DNA-directed RNA polymerase V subunit 5A-like protein [Carex littledalei]|uniref:DNA-directed RNA polymerase V subunit 5A-like protein n=1 Tax=Carex littledalei TaxID=544730 RepID=A0A833QQT3_9POAL|nr:DNA-directed RNA polymerase V subunit 5A-like protein [Carex littledalei]
MEGRGQDEMMQDLNAVPTCISAMIDTGSVESHRYFLARRTVLEMLRDRGHAVPDDEIQRTLANFRSWWEDKPEFDNLTISYPLISDSSKKTIVMFCGPDPIKKGTIREIYTRLGKEKFTRLILVVQSKITSGARDALKDLFSNKFETFHISELLVNITKHVLKPHHQVLTPEEKGELLLQYKVEDSQLPRMLEKDAVARYYGLQKGTVVKVTYEGELTGSHMTYRCVV